MIYNHVAHTALQPYDQIAILLYSSAIQAYRLIDCGLIAFGLIALLPYSHTALQPHGPYSFTARQPCDLPAIQPYVFIDIKPHSYGLFIYLYCLIALQLCSLWPYSHRPYSHKPYSLGLCSHRATQPYSHIADTVLQPYKTMRIYGKAMRIYNSIVMSIAKRLHSYMATGLMAIWQ